MQLSEGIKNNKKVTLQLGMTIDINHFKASDCKKAILKS